MPQSGFSKPGYQGRGGVEKEGGMEINNKRIGEWVEKKGGMEEEENTKREDIIVSG